MGVIDTLTAGFNRVTRRLWLILIPVLVDVSIWVGPRVSINTVAKQVILWLPSSSELGSQYAQSLELLRRWLADLGAGVNLLAALSMHLVGLPSLTATRTPGAALLGLAQGLIDVQTWPALLALMGLFSLISLFCGCVCLSFIAQEVRDEEVQVGHALQVAWRSWWRLLALLVALAILAAVAMAVLSLLSALLALLSPAVAWLALNGLTLALLWFSVYAAIAFYFTPRAVVLDDMDILHSLWSSFNVVRRNLWSTLGFIFLASLIQTGLLYIWRLLAVNSLGTMVGIVGNAYVSTGLVTAGFVFYRDRFVAWQEYRARSQSNRGSP